MKNWLSYAVSGTLAVVLSWAMTGCRLGNRVEKTMPPEAFKDPRSGLYQSKLTSMRYCATLPAGEFCNDAEPDNSLSGMSEIMSNPVVFKVVSAEEKLAAVYSPFFTGEKPPYFGFQFNDQLGVTLLTDPPKPVPLTEAPLPVCNDLIEGSGQGQVLRYDSPAHITVNGTQVPVSGRFSVNIKITEAFQGDCDPVRFDWYSCYTDLTKCGTDSTAKDQKRQDMIRGLFNPYIAVGVMTVEDIQTVKVLYQELQYE